MQAYDAEMNDFFYLFTNYLTKRAQAQELSVSSHFLSSFAL